MAAKIKRYNKSASEIDGEKVELLEDVQALLELIPDLRIESTEIADRIQKEIDYLMPAEEVDIDDEDNIQATKERLSSNIETENEVRQEREVDVSECEKDLNRFNEINTLLAKRKRILAEERRLRQSGENYQNVTDSKNEIHIAALTREKEEIVEKYGFIKGNIETDKFRVVKLIAKLEAIVEKQDPKKKDEIPSIDNLKAK